MEENRWLHEVSDDLELRVQREDGRLAVVLISKSMAAENAEPGMMVIEADELAPLTAKLMEVGMKHVREAKEMES